ncbi:Gfo/Idh/MocA family oxidoreductase [Salinisphaera sp. USBA-960]|nr:Gfo/Idh/MocA family oxidoreductase [Salifodinibacter halophilus]NNC25397.1 Gfo/Idh/MocA family oxidoreductase [Salifodinibacter halophilus]
MVIGGGAWGRNVIRNAYELGVLAGIVEGDAERAAAYAETYPDVASFDDWHQALTADCDAVAIVTPTDTHHEIALAAIAAGKDVFVEKPMAPCAEQAREMAAAAAAAGCVLMVGHLSLFQPAITRIADAIAHNELGSLLAVRHERLNLGRVRPDENVTWDLGVHDVAAMQYLIGCAPTHVRGSAFRLLGLSVADDVQAQLTFAGGVRGDLHCSWLWPETQRRTIVRGSHGMLVFDEAEQTLTLFRRWIDAESRAHNEGGEVVPIDSAEPLYAELAHFAARVVDRGQPRAGAEDAVSVLETLERLDIAAAE